MHDRVRTIRVLSAALAALVSATAAFAGGAREKQAMSPPPMMSGAAEAQTADPAMGMDLRSAPSTGRKILFTDLMTAQTQAAKGPTVLFFAADWCPTCQAALEDINTNGAKLGGITVYVVDYDKETDLKTRYAVSYQHTFVRIDEAGKALATWSGGGVEEILSHATAASAM